MTTLRISPEAGLGPTPGRRRAPARPLGRALVSLLGATVALTSLGPISPARAQTGGCYTGSAPEESGPTDISAVSGNRSLTAAFNPKGTLTVLKWPSPSFYDQLDYRTLDRSLPRMGAARNDGSFLGAAWRRAKTGSKWHFSWLRSWKTTQRFADPDSDVVVTRHVNGDAGLRVTVRDVVAADRDALARHVTVSRSKRSPARNVRLFAFANFNPVFSKSAGTPDDDWCDDEGSDQGASYLKGSDAIAHSAAGTDGSTGESSSVAIVMGFDGRSDGHSVGVDPTDSSYDDSVDAELANNSTSTAQSDAALFESLSLRGDRKAVSTVILAAARTRTRALDVLRSVRKQGFERVRRSKNSWWRNWLKVSPLPKGAPGPVVRLAKRSLISLRQAIDKDGLIVTSIATQAPLGLDWVRNGAYMNAALLEAHHPREVKRHNRSYEDLQARISASTIPRGNWPTSMYADGVPGSSTPYEIDSTGLGLWTLWDAYQATRDINYLADIYDPGIRAAADHLTTTCITPATGLQCFAHEEGSSSLRRTLVGAQAAWAGLDAAVRAAKVAMDAFGHSSQRRDDWRARRNELHDAIVANFYDGACKCYTKNLSTGGTLLWPVRLFPRGSKEANRQAELNWRRLKERVRGDVKKGGMEARAILGNAHAWGNRDRKLAQLEKALEWMARRSATRRTGLLGGAWRVRKGRVDVMRSQPHAWHHAMFYLASLKTYGERAYRF